MPGRIHIGTSGWSYKHWKGVFYPEKIKTGSWLDYYAQHFNVTEINRSFYKLPSPETVGSWTKQVPSDFLFCPKMSRYLTHMKKLNEPEEPLERFFGIFKVMKKKMRPVLIQLPPFLKFDYDRASHFYQLLKKKYRAYNFAVEVRHDSWLKKESTSLMSNYDVSLVISQSEKEFPYKEIITAENIYVRFHGPRALYASPYPDHMLRLFARKFGKWMKEGHELWVFFNNDVHGYAVEDAKKLLGMI